MRDLSKIRCYRCNELGHRIRDCLQLKDPTKVTVAAAQNSNKDETDDYVLMVSDEVSTSFYHWILDSTYLHHVCYRKELFNSLKSSENIVHLSDGSSCAIEDIKTISMKVHDGIIRKLDEV